MHETKFGVGADEVSSLITEQIIKTRNLKRDGLAARVQQAYHPSIDGF